MPAQKPVNLKFTNFSPRKVLQFHNKKIVERLEMVKGLIINVKKRINSDGGEHFGGRVVEQGWKIILLLFQVKVDVKIKGVQ